MLKNSLKKIIINISNRYPSFFYKIGRTLSPKEMCNINLDLCNQGQKRVLISYISLIGFDFKRIQHASYHHLNQIIHYFISKNYCIDVCRLDDMGSYERLKNNKYDIIFGFGSVYKKFCKEHNIPLKINFIMENYPETVTKKYTERIEYFKKRHPQINHELSYARVGYFDIETFEISDYAIYMNSNYNAIPLRKHFNSLYLINSNAIFNLNYQFNKETIKNTIERNRNNLLWFGSLGIIHKGLDILIDTVDILSEYKLSCFGIDKREYELFKKLKNKNTIDCGTINVLSDAFYEKVILNFNFVIFPSCSEGMSTAIATCMAHGIIPIITKECGFESDPCIIELDDFKIESIISTIRRIEKMSIDEILEMREKCYYYARNNFSLNNFDINFRNIMNQIL